MIRTQVYLTEKQRKELSDIAKTTKRKQSELIREAIDLFISHSGRKHRNSVLDKVAGLWKSRSDIPDFHETRAAWDRD